MGAFKFFFSFLLSVSLLAESGEKVSSVKNLELEVGEVHELSLKGISKINLSKRGVVLLSSTGENSWRLVGHRKGFVVLSYKNERLELDEQILIEVRAKKEEKHLQFIHPFCAEKGISCTSEPNKIEGKAESWKVFYQLKAWCADKRTCLFSLTLEEKALLDLRDQLDTYLPFVTDKKVNSSGLLTGSVSCHEKGSIPLEKTRKAKAILDDLGLKVPLHLSCLHDLKKRRYKILAQVVLLSKNLTEDLGVSRFLEGDLLDNNFSLSPSFLKHIKAHKNESQFEIVGTPVLNLIEGVEGITKTGGEISLVKEKYSGRGRSEFLDWKSYGLSLESLVHSDPEGRGRTRFHLKMSVPSVGGARLSLETLEMKGEVLLSPGKAKLVGSTDYERNKKSHGAHRILSKIPLIAPLFKQSQTEKSLSRVYLYLMLKEINEKNE